MKCSIRGCKNIRPKMKEKPSDKYFFTCPKSEQRRPLWMIATEKNYSAQTKFIICEDHFDMRKDIDFYRTNGTPVLMRSAYPHRNLTPPDMALQAKLDKVNWSCFVPTCANRRLMADKKLVFFPVPDGLRGLRWRSAVSEDKRFWNVSLLDDEIQFCCEEHFDITMDLRKSFAAGSSVVYTVKDDVLPSQNLSGPNMIIWNEIKPCQLSDSHAHPRVILNNDVSYLYGDKYPLLIEKLQATESVTFVDIKDVNDIIKSEPIELEQIVDIKTEPMDTGYEYEHQFDSELLIKREETDCDPNPLDIQPKTEYESERESESDSSSANHRENENDPDITSDDFSTSNEESSEESDASDYEPESTATEEDCSDLDKVDHFECCCYCNQMVRHLDSHVQRVHWNFSKNVNHTRCGLCSAIFPRPKELRQHQDNVHDGNAYACDVCDSLLRTYGDVENHIIRSHCKERPLLCQQCGLGYKFPRDLQRHEERQHMGALRQRTHVCDLCEKKFFNSSALRKHVRCVHENVRQHRCDVDGCNKAYHMASYLKLHQKRVHLKQDHHSCIICAKTFSFKANLTVHMKNVHKT